MAAARHRVGAAALGGSWQLDYRTGPIEADLPFAADRFQGVLDLDDQWNREGDNVDLAVAFDAPAGPLMFTVSGLPDGLSLVPEDDHTARITGTLTYQAAETGFFETTVTASGDTYDGSQTFYWFVDPAPPDLTVSEDLEVPAGIPVTLQVSATDSDGIAEVQWEISFNGDDFEVEPDLTALTVSYTFPTYGEYDVLVTVTDGRGHSSTNGFHVTATDGDPTASLITASGPIIRGDTVTFAAAVVDPDALDTVSLYMDWQGTDNFDQLDLAQCWLNPDGSIGFEHVYWDVGNFTAVLRVADDDGEDTDYPINVVVLGVTPAGTLTTTSDYSWVPSGSEVTTWAMRTGDLLQFTNVTPADTPGLEYHFFLTDEAAGTTAETVRETPTLALPDYAAGKRYQVRGYVKDKFSDNQSPEQTLNVVVGDPRQGLWGTLAVDGEPPAPPAGPSPCSRKRRRHCGSLSTRTACPCGLPRSACRSGTG